jgi:hypothetical protein
MWLKTDIDRTADRSPYAVKPLTRAQFERGIAIRKYAWNKPVQQIADEAGVPKDIIYKVLKNERVSDAAYTLLTSYLRTPAGPWALINNRSAKASEKSARRAWERKVGRLSAMAVGYGLKVLSKARLAGMTLGQLQAYYHRLDFKVRDKIVMQHFDVSRQYIVPDSLEAWEWIERFGQLRERRMTSASARSDSTQPRPGFPGGRPNPSTSPGLRSR